MFLNGGTREDGTDGDGLDNLALLELLGAASMLRLTAKVLGV